MTDPASFWPGVLGISFLFAGIVTYRRDFQAGPRGVFGLAAFGPVFVAAALAAVTHPAVRMYWSLAARETTFAIGALALFATATAGDNPRRAAALATVARVWTAAVLVFYGIENVLYPQFAPGVPSTVLTPPGVPLPTLVTYATGILLVAFGLTMFARKLASTAAARCGLLLTLLTLALYAPQWAIARGVAQQITAINFVFDTLLFAGSAFVIGRAIPATTNATA